MYNLVTAIGVKKSAGARWSTVDISNVPVNQLFGLYRKMFITLSNSFLENNITIDFETLRLEYSSLPSSFSTLLTSLGNTALTTVSIPPVLKPKFAVYRDAFRTGYKVEPVKIGVGDSSLLPVADRTSLKLTKSNPLTDMEVFYNNCLVSVNGYYHKTDFDGTAAYVVDGAKSMLHSKQNQIGVLSFLPIGTIESVSITESMIFKQADDSNLKKRIYLKLPQPTIGKTVILVLGGYLVFPESGVFWQTGDDVFAIDIMKLPFVERYFESKEYLDLSALDLPVNTVNPSATKLSELYSDETLTKYLTLPQSFFCIVNTESLFTNRIPLRSSARPGMMIAYTEPNYPMFVGHGRTAEYWSVFEDGQWAVNVENSYQRNKLSATQPESFLNIINDSDLPEMFASNSQGYLLEIGKDF